MNAIALDLSAVLDRIVDGVTVQDQSGRLVYANAVAARRLGFATPEDLLQSAPATFNSRYVMYDQDGEPLSWDQLPGRLVLAGQESAETPIRFHDLATGEERWAVAHATALDAPDGSRLAVNIFRDVTGQVVAETATREREARLTALLAALPDLMFVQAPDGTFLEYHADDESHLHAPPSVFLGKKPEDVLPPEIVASVMPALTRTAQTGESTSVEYPLNVASEERHYETRIVRLDDERVLSIVRDLTDRVKAETALAEQRRFADRVAAASPAILYVYDAVQGRTVYANDALTHLLGYRPEAILGLTDPPFAGLLHPEDHARWSEMAAEIWAAADGEVVEQAYRLRHADGRWRWLASRATVMTRTPDGAPHLVVGAALDVTAQREADEALRASEARYRAVVESQSELVARYLPDTTLTFVNDAYCRFFGQTREALVGTPFMGWLPPAAHARMREVIAAVSASTEPVTYEHEVAMPDGTLRHLQWVDSAIRDASGAVVELQGAGRDVTDRVRAEEALAASRRLADRVGAASPDIHYVFDVTDGRTVYVNDAIGRVLGYSAAQLTDAEATDPMALRHPDDRATLQAAVAKVLAAADGEVVEFAFRMRHADGSWRWLATRATVLSREPDGRPRLVVGAALDVTALRKTEAALRESEERYRAVVDSQSEMICRYLPGSTTITFVNDANCRAAGRTREDLLGRSLLDLAPASDRARLAAYFATLAADPRTAEIEHRVDLPDGSVGWEHWIDTPIYDPAGRLVEFQGVGRDVTDLRRTEEALRKSEMRFREVVNQQTDLVARYLPDSTLTFVNDAYCQFFGRSREELIGTRFLDYDPPWTHEKTLARLKMVGNSPEPTTLEQEEYLPDGSLGWIQWANRAIRDAGGNLVEIQGVGRDVTALRRAEKALQVSEARYREVVNLQTDLVSRYLPDSTLTFVNEAYCRFMGRSREELIGSRFIEFIPPSVQDYVRDCIRRIVESQEPVATEHEMYVRGGGLGVMHWVDHAIRDDHGVVVEIQGVGRDVTELRQAESALRASETNLRLALDNAKMGTWDWSIESGWIAWSERTGTLYGMPANTTGVTWENFLSLIHPDDRERVDEKSGKRIADGADYGVEYRVFWPDGSLHWLERRGGPLPFNREGRATRFLGVTMDVTERKKSETTLRELSQRLMSSQDEERRRLARELHDGMAQDVFALTVTLAALDHATLPMEGPAQTALAEAQRLAEQVLWGLRTHSYLLHPPLLDLVGLPATLREYAAGLVKQGGLTIDTTAVEDVGRLPDEVETALFRVAQEALSNVARHAETDRAVLTLQRDEEAVELSVADTGKGLAEAAAQKAWTIGIGIAGMHERLNQIGGYLDIRSGKGGTTVAAHVPAALCDS